MTEKTAVVLALTSRLLFAEPAHADVNIGISVGTPAPPPPIVVTAPPQLVLVPGTAVYYAPGASFNLFVYRGRYYSFHNGLWFHASSPTASWAVIAGDRVPQPVLAVPVTYYRIPPGHARKPGAGPPGHARGPKWKKGGND